MEKSQERKVTPEESSDHDTGSIVTDLGDATGFIGSSETLILDEKQNRKLLRKIGKASQ
jgi:hypothetical protein